jgi:hypothetical protein
MRLPAALAVAVFVLSLAAVLVTPRCTRDRVVDVAPWVEAVASASALVRPGDVVLVHPPWREDVARALRTSAVLPRAALATTALAPRHGAPLPAVVVVSDGTAPLPRAWRALVEPVGAVAFGGVTVKRLSHAPSSARRSLLDDLASARVELVPGLASADRVAPGGVDDGEGGERPRTAPSACCDQPLRAGGLRAADGLSEGIGCPWSAVAQRHECTGMPAWLHVGVESLPVGGKVVRCAWAHPKTGKVLVIRFERVRLLDELVVSLGLTDGAAANPRGAPVIAVLRVDGVERARVTKVALSRGFIAQRIDIADAPREAHVEIELTTADDGQRHACFQLDTVMR